MNENILTKETKQFWSKIWERGKHKNKAEWMNNMKKLLQRFKEVPKMKIKFDSLRAIFKKYRIWKSWATMTYIDSGFKNSLRSMRNWPWKKCLEETDILEYRTKKERQFWFKKTPQKGTIPNNYRPIKYLPMIWKILTSQIWDNSQISCGLFPRRT